MRVLIVIKRVGAWIASIKGWWLGVSALGSLGGISVAIWEDAPLWLILALAVNLFVAVLAGILLGVELNERWRLSRIKREQQQLILARLNSWGPNKINLADATALWSLTANPHEYEWKAKFKTLKKACREGVLPIAVLAGKKPNRNTAVRVVNLKIFLRNENAIPKED